VTFFERVGVWFGDPQSDVDHELAGDQLVSVRRVAFVLLGLALVWWPLDPIVFAGKPHIIRGFAYYRGSVALLLCVLLALVTAFKSIASRPLRAFVPVAWALAVVTGAFIGSFGPPSTAWLGFLYPAMFFNIAGPSSLRTRVIGQAGGMLGILAGYFLPYPQNRADSYAAVGVSFFVACAIIGVAAGHLAYRNLVLALTARRELRQNNEHLEDRVREQTRALADLAVHLDRASEAERKHIARELHDELGQELAALRFSASVARRRSEERADTTASLAQIETLIARVSATLRRVLQGLNPLPVIEHGPKRALETLIDDARAKGALAVEAAIDEVVASLDGERGALLFRVLQEALTNAHRHARASKVSVRVRSSDAGLELVVWDDGVGFDPAQRSMGMGLRGMRERLRELGGELTITSTPSEGTSVIARLPPYTAEPS
jgi:signal transduction histidine kinase